MCMKKCAKAQEISQQQITLTEENIYSEIIKEITVLDDAEVHEAGSVLVVIPEVYQLMKQSKEIVLDTNIGEDMRLQGVIANLDGLNVIKVSKSRLPEDFGFMIAHPMCNSSANQISGV